MYRYPRHTRDILPRDWVPDQAQHISTPRSASRSVLEVRVIAHPFAQPLAAYWRFEAGWEVHIRHRHEVGFDGGFVGLFQAREGEGAGDEVAGCWVGARGRLVWVERPAVVFGWFELVARCLVLAKMKVWIVYNACVN